MTSPERIQVGLIGCGNIGARGYAPSYAQIAEAELERLLERIVASGGTISSKASPDCSTSPYELNITYFDFLNGDLSNEPEDLQIEAGPKSA